jgi:hypothetical protein
VVSITPPPSFSSGEKTPGTHCTGGWVDPRAGLDPEVRRKILCLCRGSNPGRPVRSQSLYWLSYPCSLSDATVGLNKVTSCWNRAREENSWAFSLSCTSAVQLTTLHISPKSVLMLFHRQRLGPSSCLSPRDSPTKMLCVFLTSSCVPVPFLLHPVWFI